MEISATYLPQLMLNGLMLGLIYALIAVGLALIFGVIEVSNFTHGELLTPGQRPESQRRRGSRRRARRHIPIIWLAIVMTIWAFDAPLRAANCLTG